MTFDDMVFNNEFDAGDVVNTLILTSAVIGLFFTFVQLKRNAKTQRAIFFKELYGVIHSDITISQAYTKIEYNEFSYEPEFHGSNDEYGIDKLLNHCDLVCTLYFKGFVEEEEMKFFDYPFTRIYTNSEIQKYFAFLDHFSERIEVKTRSFDSFRRHCEKTAANNT